MNPDMEARIRERAYALWVEDGRPEGRSDEYWYRAEREVKAEAGSPGSPDGSASEDVSVFTVPDSEMLSGTPDPGTVPGGPDVPSPAAAGVAPVAPAPKRRRATRAK